MNIKAAVFDYGGVISFPPTPEIEAETARLCGISVQFLRELNRKYRGELDRGTFNCTEYFRYILSEKGIFPDERTLEKIASTDTSGWRHINQDTVTLMRDIKSSGLKLGILSNMPHDFLFWVRNSIPIINEADVAVFSCEHKIIKPEAAIYEKLKCALSCEYKEIVFFDDIQDNVTKAGELGINAFFWEGPEKARDLLKISGRGFEKS